MTSYLTDLSGNKEIWSFNHIRKAFLQRFQTTQCISRIGSISNNEVNRVTTMASIIFNLNLNQKHFLKEHILIICCMINSVGINIRK